MIINKLKLDLCNCMITPVVDAVQGDINSRILEISLHSGKQPFLLPENLAVRIRYKKADGKGGEYDTLPDGASAWSARSHILTIMLAPQVLTFPGFVNLTVTLVSEGKQLSTFPLQINVSPAARPADEDSEDYFNITGFLVAPGNAKAGQYLQVSSVDGQGRVTAVEATDFVSAGSGSGGAQADWNAAADAPGHILNRPFYTETETRTVLEETIPEFIESEGAFRLADTFPVTVGCSYMIDWNGVQYTCTAQDVSAATAIAGMVGLGDCTAWAEADQTLTGNAEPFVILVVPANLVEEMGAGGMIMPLDGCSALTISIVGDVETVYPLPGKYLAEARAQKKIILDLDNNSASIPVSETPGMDTGELQAAITAVYNGTEHSVLILSRSSQEYEGTVYNSVEFVIVGISDDPLPRVFWCVWNYDGVTVHSESVLANPIAVEYNEVMLYGKLPADNAPFWRKITDIPFEGLLLKSATANSSKTFLLSVDDTGTLSVTSNQI